LRNKKTSLTEDVVNVATGDTTAKFPSALQVDSILPDGSFIYFIAGKITSIDTSKGTIELKDKNNQNYIFSLPLKNVLTRPVLSIFEAKSVPRIWEEKQYFVDTQDTKVNLYSKQVIIVWKDNRSMVDLESLIKDTKGNLSEDKQILINIHVTN
jgi:hypothetical protein